MHLFNGKIFITFLFLIFAFCNDNILSQVKPDINSSFLQESYQLRTENDYINYALANNPEIKALQNKILAFGKKVIQAKSLDAPNVGFEAYNTPVKTLNPFGGMEYDYSVEQMLPFPGKLSLMGQMATNNVNMLEEELNALKRKIIFDIKSAYYEIYFIQRKIEINKQNQDWMKRFTDVANRQYQVGIGMQRDVLKSQVEFVKLMNEELSLQKELKIAVGMLNSILNRPQNSEVGQIAEIEPDTTKFLYDEMEKIALENRNELKAMKYNIEMNKTEYLLSKRELYPDLMTRLMYKQMMDEDDFWSAMVSVNVPISFWSYNKYKSKIQESELNIKKSEEEFNSMKNMVLFEVQSSLTKVNTSQKQIKLYKWSIIPQAEQTLTTTISAYQTNKVDFLTLIDSYFMLQMSKLDYYMSVMNCLQGKAELEKAVGKNLEGS
jgi:outer membrane protein TolC